MTDNINLVFKKLNDDIKKSYKDKSLWKRVGEETVRSIRATTVLGKGVSENESKAEKFEPLAESTKKARGKKKLSSLTSKNKSNLRETGKMFDDLKEYPSDNGVVIKFKTARSQEIANYHHEGNANLPQRKFMFLSKAQINLIARLLRENLAKIKKGN